MDTSSVSTAIAVISLHFIVGGRAPLGRPGRSQILMKSLMSRTNGILSICLSIQTPPLPGFGPSNLTRMKLELFDGLQDISSPASYKAACNSASPMLPQQAPPEYLERMLMSETRSPCLFPRQNYVPSHRSRFILSGITTLLNVHTVLGMKFTNAVPCTVHSF
jgi:hypothetical protein